MLYNEAAADVMLACAFTSAQSISFADAFVIASEKRIQD